MTTPTHPKRHQGAYRLAAAAFAGGLLFGTLAGWNFHENSDVRSNYIADLPTCTEAEK